jgi:beta-galactosidase
MKIESKVLFACVTCILATATLEAAERKASFNLGWRFVRENVAGAEGNAFDDSSWKTVSAPHTYNDVDTFDDMSPGGHAGESNQWGGKTWYRKRFTAPADWKNKTVIIEFEAVRQVADVYCNGVKVGSCENGFMPFGADLTKHLRCGEENVIAVMCDNQFRMNSDKDPSVSATLPWNNPHWHPAHGGLYRNVFLHVSDKLHFTQPLYNNLKTVGTYVYAVNPSRGQTGIVVEAEVANETGSAQSVRIQSRVLDREGKVALELDAKAELAVGQTAIVVAKGTLKTPKLWEPKHPYLYTVVSTIVRGGDVVDTMHLPFGVRWALFTKERGFFINDRYVKLQGWGQKSMDGWPGLGAANPDWMHYYTLQMITEAGGNFIRWGHTAGGPAQIRSSDELGIVTLQPGVDGEGDVGGHAWDVRAAAWRDGVVYYRNNPSILIWEGGNQSVSKDHVEELSGIVKKYDPHGGRVYAHRRANGTVEPYCNITISTEGSGSRPGLPAVEGEYNREESPRRVWDRKTPPYENWHAKGSYDLSSEEFAINQLINYDKIASPRHCGGANWIFTDSTSGGRLTTEVTRASGEVDAMRLPKEAYHVCRVIFTDEPDLHLIGHWNYPPGTVKDVYVAADCDEVTLSLNGKQLAGSASTKQKGGGTRKHRMLFAFPAVTWEPGRLVAVGYVQGKEVARQELVTTGEAVALKLSTLTGPTGLLADGSDAVVVTVEAVDKDGRRCPTFEQRVDFDTKGPGVWRGGYNSGKAKSTNNTYLDLECGVNRVIVRSTLTAGTITVKAETKGLPPATIEIQSQPVPMTDGFAAPLPVLPKQVAMAELPSPTEKPTTTTGGSAPASPEPAASKCFNDVSYSGPARTIQIGKTATGKPMYSDHAMPLPKLPEVLNGGEYIALPNADWNYSAVDLLQFESAVDAVVYVAHDSRLPKMDWLQKGFEATEHRLVVGEFSWQLYRKSVKAGESVLLGSNTEIKGDHHWMMVVFSVPRK